MDDLAAFGRGLGSGSGIYGSPRYILRGFPVCFPDA